MNSTDRPLKPLHESTRKPMRNLSLILFALLLALLAPVAMAANPLLVLSYHDIRDDVAPKGDADGYAVSTQNFAAHLDWLDGRGYQPVSLQQVIDAADGSKELPDRAVLLTFDDGLSSVYTKAYPLLRAYNYPALVAVVTDWVDLPQDKVIDYGPRGFNRADFLSWAQLREMKASGLIEIASHSHDLHHGILSNPQGNTRPAAVTRQYDPASGHYENETEYFARVRADLRHSASLIRQHTGQAPRTIVWPYAAYNSEANQIAEELGMPVSFDLEGRTTQMPSDLHGLARLLLTDNPTTADLAYSLRAEVDTPSMRAVQVDLDALYDEDSAQMERNLGVLLDRIKRIGPNAVFLQAFADPDGNGSADALYFPNRYMPMRADLFNRVSWQLKTRTGVAVYAWLPVLGYEFPDENPETNAIPGVTGKEVYRVDFTSPEMRTRITGIYQDLTANASIDGLLFHDDAYLRDTELTDILPDGNGNRTRQLIDFTLELQKSAQRWQPKLKTVRNLFARPVLHPESQAWFAQRLDLFNQAYDYTALMAMPWMENSDTPVRWMDRLVDAAREHDPEFKQTMFELQTVDWRDQSRIPDEVLKTQVRRLIAQGVHHIGWYPDDFIGNHPDVDAAREVISARSFPYEGR